MFVVDASVTLAWYAAAQVTTETDAVLNMLHSETGLVPVIWLLEVTTVLAVAQRRGRMSESQVHRTLESLRALPIEIDPLDRDVAFSTVVDLARERDLTTYGAAYLELAQRRGLALATTDSALRAAAAASGTALVLA